MIHPTRTNLLLLKDKSRSVANSIGILKGRRQALIRGFLDAASPFLRSREDIRKSYGRGLVELALAMGCEGEDFVASLEGATRRELGVEVAERDVMGLKYRDVAIHGGAVTSPDERGYDYRAATPHLEESFALFETIVESMLQVAAFESKLKRLGDEILRIMRRIRVLEERIQPEISRNIRTIGAYIGEREREAYYRLKHFKEKGRKGLVKSRHISQLKGEFPHE